MGHIVYITNGMASTLHSSFGLSRRLEQAGHRISYISHVDVEQAVTLNGFAFYPLTAERTYQVTLRRNGMPRSSLTRPDRWLRWVAQRRRIRRQSIDNDEIERLIRRLDPDLLVIDIECHFAVIAIAELRIPTVLAIVWFTLFRHPNLPPLHTSMMPGSSGYDRLAIGLAWWWLRACTVGREWRQRFGWSGLASSLRPVAYGTNRYPELRAIARSRGYDLGAETDRAQWLRPMMYSRLPILCFNAWELEFPHARHPNLHYVGPMIDPQRREAQVDAACAAQWRRFKRGRRPDAATHRPLGDCSLGTGFLGRILEVFGRRPEWDLVLGLGGRLSAAALVDVPPNVLLLDWAPQVEVLQHADCAITHGGITTINECIRAEVPMVVYSTKHVDQNGCAARVAYHGLGIMADKDTDTTERIERNIAQVLSDATMRRKLAQMREHFLAYERANAAVGMIEAQLARRPTASQEH